MTQEEAMNMSNEQAVQILIPMRNMMCDQNGCPISDAVFALDKAIEALSADRPTGKWIPCSERLPLPDENPVIVSWMGIVNIGWYSCGRWETGTRLPMDGVEAWMPLPKPWKGECE